MWIQNSSFYELLASYASYILCLRREKEQEIYFYTLEWTYTRRIYEGNKHWRIGIEEGRKRKNREKNFYPFFLFSLIVVIGEMEWGTNILSFFLSFSLSLSLIFLQKGERREGEQFCWFFLRSRDLLLPTRHFSRGLDEKEVNLLPTCSNSENIEFKGRLKQSTERKEWKEREMKREKRERKCYIKCWWLQTLVKREFYEFRVRLNIKLCPRFWCPANHHDTIHMLIDWLSDSHWMIT